MGNEWNIYTDTLPEMGVEVLAQSDEWIHPDFNTQGIRIGFQNLTLNRADDDFKTSFCSAKFCNSCDEWHTDTTPPTKWKNIN